MKLNCTFLIRLRYDYLSLDTYRKQIKKRIEIFIKDPHALSLKTHKLKGELVGYCSFSVSYDLRILFEFIDDKTVGFVDIGTHGVYKKWGA